jgi:hypothetical protein
MESIIVACVSVACGGPDDPIRICVTSKISEEAESEGVQRQRQQQQQQRTGMGANPIEDNTGSRRRAALLTGFERERKQGFVVSIGLSGFPCSAGKERRSILGSGQGSDRSIDRWGRWS